MNSYMKWLHEFIYIWIHDIWNEYMNSWGYEFMYMNWNVWNDYMNSYTSEFRYEMNEWIHEDMNSCTWIQMYGFWIHIWIHKYLNWEFIVFNLYSWIWFHLWVHVMNSLLKIDENSMFWIHDIEFSSEIWHMNILYIARYARAASIYSSFFLSFSAFIARPRLWTSQT